MHVIINIFIFDPFEIVSEMSVSSIHLSNLPKNITGEDIKHQIVKSFPTGEINKSNFEYPTLS